MKKLFLLSLMVFLCIITSINAFAEMHQTDVTIAEGADMSEDNFDVYGAVFTNYGTFHAASFSASNATCINRGELNVTYYFSLMNGAKFTNDATLTIDSVPFLTISAGTTFTNTGVVYLSKIQDCDLSGTITVSGDGYIVYDETVAQSVVDRLKEICGEKLYKANNTEVNQNETSANEESTESSNTVSGELGGSMDVNAKYEAGTPESTEYKVDITWGRLEFTYTDSSKGTWNTATHQYDGAKDAKWTCATGDNEITITNHSNAPVTATATYTPKSGYDTVSMTFSDDTVNLGTADNGINGAAGTPTSAKITVIPSGTLKKSETQVVIGTITIRIS